MKNQLSAFMDGELSVEESAHLITSAKIGGELINAGRTTILLEIPCAVMLVLAALLCSTILVVV